MLTCKRRQLDGGFGDSCNAILNLIFDVVDVVVNVRTFREFALCFHIIRQIVHVKLQGRPHNKFSFNSFTVGNT